MAVLKALIKDILTAKDGESYDIGRVLWIIGALSFIGLSIYDIYRGNPFNPLNWGTGFGGIMGGGGAAIGLKSRTEPE